ncbi:ATP-binding protein [Cryptosporangium arvum]|uniref:Putative transcriptional regulator n=1 Tax=Cryptosporangium arvum DSM 44712 TaxID=927661 RepID=A0A010Z1B3_9ACTN|nr:AAA family ATPase [Cryptosporangium arvum]EXG81218.1 putative transcriptional regulator [Cryptosporangium arvum DSM 44712]
MTALRLAVLGPLRIWRGDVELDPGPRQQVYLLTLLLARAGRPVSATELIELIWDDDPPATALNTVQKYVGSLRRLLDPSLLRRRGNGYVFVAGPETLDLVAFRQLIAEARRSGDLDRYVAALKLWRGPAGEGLDHGPAATAVFAALDAEFFDACVAAAELAGSLGRAERVLQPLLLAALMAPLHEPVQASLVAVLAAAGQQAEALAVYRAVRDRLVGELGIEPGPALRAAHARVLERSPVPTPGRDAPALVGRRGELAVVRDALDAAFADEAGLVLVEGEPGVGKTSLLEAAAAEAERRGAMVVWGHCVEGEGAPSMWPWVQAIGAIVDGRPDAEREKWLAGELGRLLEPRDDVLGEPRGGVLTVPVRSDTGAQFRLFERVLALLAQVAARQPLLLVLDDLQWADVASLQLFGHLAARPPRRTVVVGALRDRAPVPGAELTRVLATASRNPRHRRTRLGPLGPGEVAELVVRETGRPVSAELARRVHERTAGNPFFVRELARLLASSGAAAGLPAGVRDVVVDRMAGLDAVSGELLRIAALIGRDVELGLLARAAGLGVPDCLDRVEPIEALGLLAPVPGDSFALRFPHDLIRESVLRTTPAAIVPRLHLRVADALDREDDVETLAHHLAAAGPLADPGRTAKALVGAGRRAAAKSALATAERQLRSAAGVARAAGRDELELSALSQLIAVVGMRSGYAGSALDELDRAEQLARGLGRERDATDFLYSRCATYSQTLQFERARPLARRLLEDGEASADPIVRGYGVHAWGIHQWDLGNIGEAYRYLRRLDVGGRADRETHRLRHDLLGLSPAILAQVTALHGEVDAAREMFETVAAAAGDDPHAVTLTASFTSTTAMFVGDPAWALSAAERGIAADPGFSFVFYGAYLRMNRWWAHAVTGRDPARAAAEIEALITATVLDPPLTGVSTRFGQLAEAWLAAGEPDHAAAALDRAEDLLTTYGQRYAEGHILLQRARLLQARGAPADAVRAAVERARAVSTQREAHLFARRAAAVQDTGTGR